MPRRIVVNTCFGGFSLSEEAKTMYKKATVDQPQQGSQWYIDEDISRDDPVLLQVIDEIGLNNAGGYFSKLDIVEIPDDIPVDGWVIQEYDGKEWVAERHRTWHADPQ